MKKIICFALSLLVVVACENKKTQPASSDNDVDLSTLLGPEPKDSTDVNLSELAKKKGAEPEPQSPKKEDPVVGMFVCKKTNDKYIFNDDGTGFFFTKGANSEFKWQHKNDIIIITYEDFGKEHLLFDSQKKTLKENSETFGVLIFNKI